MSTIQNLFQQAQLAEAAYANFSGMNALSPKSDIERALTTGGMKFSTAQASTFAARYQVISHQPNTDSGFSATLFLDTTNGQYTFARIKGVSSASHLISQKPCPRRRCLN